MSSGKIETLQIAAFLYDIERYCSENGIDGIVNEVINKLPSSFRAEDVAYWFDKDGSLSWIISLAEEVCQGNDGFYGEKGARLESVVASASLFEAKGVTAYLPVSLREKDFCIPSSQDSMSVGEIFTVFRRHIQSICDNDYEQFFASLDSLAEHCFSSLPSSIPGVSLYQRAKTKTAVASALYLYAAEHGFDETLCREEKAFVLLSCDATGIQKYIFGVNTYKHSAKLIRARSFQIWIQSFLIAGYICHFLGLTNSNIISFSGGKFLLLLPNTAKLQSLLPEVRAQIDNLCIDDYSGEIAYVISSGVECSADDLNNSNASGIQRLIRLDGASSKQKKLQAGILSSERRAVLDTQYEILSKVGSLCAACEANPVKNNDTDFCLNCDYLIELGRLLNIDDAYIYLNFNEIASLNKTVAIKSDYRYKAGWQAFSVSRYSPGHARISMPYYVPSDENGDVLTFSDISQKADGVKKLGMFKADVDYLGLVFSSSLKERWSLSRYAALSSSFHFFFSEYLLETIKANYKNLYVVFSGGDDVCVIGPWNEIIRFSRDFNELFHSFTCNNHSLTVSAGIVVFSPSDPIPVVAQEAEDALEMAKNEKDKNSVSLFSRTVSWPVYVQMMEDARVLSGLVKESKSGFLYRLLTYSDNALALQSVQLEHVDIRKALWISHFRYSLKRYEINDKNCKSVLEKYSSPEIMKNAKIAATIALYTNRR